MARGSVPVWLSIVALARQENAAVEVRHVVLACAQAARAGATLSMSSAYGLPEPVFATDARSEELEELQATLGQGPCMEALTGSAPVLAEDLADARVASRWPELATAALARGVAAIFSVPVSSGAARVGALCLYRKQAGGLSADELGVLLLYADAVRRAGRAGFHRPARGGSSGLRHDLGAARDLGHRRTGGFAGPRICRG